MIIAQGDWKVVFGDKSLIKIFLDDTHPTAGADLLTPSNLKHTVNCRVHCTSVDVHWQRCH